MSGNKKIRVGIVGGAGYTGGELLRILINHPNADISFIHSRSNAGAPVHKVHTDLVGDTDICFSAEHHDDVNVLFLCVGHGEASTFLDTHAIKSDTRIIDLSQDFRLAKKSKIKDRSFVYGLPEVNRESIQEAHNIANPGCFATAIQLGLLPLAKAGLLQEVHTTGITGSTGAGQKLQATSHFTWRANNVQAYKTLSHQHVNEIMETIAHLQPAHKSLNFVPMRGDFTRGIYATSYTRCSINADTAYELYNAYYAAHPFTHVSREPIDLKQVVNTNKCMVYLEQEEGRLIVHSVIDNLTKGASGQAVQNMNIMFGLDEQAGLKLKATAF